MPAFAAENSVERRAQRRNLPAGECAQHHRVVSLVHRRFFRDPAVVRIAETRHEGVVLRFGLVLFLLEPMKDDVSIRRLEP